MHLVLTDTDRDIAATLSRESGKLTAFIKARVRNAADAEDIRKRYAVLYLRERLWARALSTRKPSPQHTKREQLMNGETIECKQPAGVIKPRVDFNKCEGKADCVRVCPENVFAMARINDEDYRELRLLSRFKLRVHGMQVAYTPNVDACRSCGLCVSACPENAITLASVLA